MNDTAMAITAEHKDSVGIRMGMWLFLMTEILLFGGLFLVYSVYRYLHPADFHFAASGLNVTMGAANTAVLLTSSLFMALAVTAVRKGHYTASKVFLTATMAMGVIFLSVKYFEWTAKISHGLYPGSERLLERVEGEILFYGLYFISTGLHGAHVVIGMALMSVMMVWLVKGRITRDNYAGLENTGLYWHLVDIIWIFLFPLFYLIT